MLFEEVAEFSELYLQLLDFNNTGNCTTLCQQPRVDFMVATFKIHSKDTTLYGFEKYNRLRWTKQGGFCWCQELEGWKKHEKENRDSRKPCNRRSTSWTSSPLNSQGLVTVYK